MQFDGKISIREVERSPFKIESDESDAWVVKLLERSAPKAELTGMSAATFAGKSKLRVSVQVEQMGGDYQITGNMSGQVPAGCARCAEPFMADRETTFRVFLVTSDALQDEPSDDPDYIPFRGDQINLIEHLAEQLIVLERVAEAPELKANGSCVLCHRNSDELVKFSSGQSLQNIANSPFSQLGNLLKKKGQRNGSSKI
jgi:uncharacterized metal-binding protein YceD (DUF177 family)